MFSYLAGSKTAPDKRTRARYLETKREMQLLVQEAHSNITRIRRTLNARHLKERNKLARLIKYKNKQLERAECDRVVPTPRARPVCFTGRSRDLLDMGDGLDVFAMKELSEGTNTYDVTTVEMQVWYFDKGREGRKKRNLEYCHQHIRQKLFNNFPLSAIVAIVRLFF